MNTAVQSKGAYHAFGPQDRTTGGGAVSHWQRDRRVWHFVWSLTGGAWRCRSHRQEYPGFGITLPPEHCERAPQPDHLYLRDARLIPGPQSGEPARGGADGHLPAG